MLECTLGGRVELCFPHNGIPLLHNSFIKFLYFCLLNEFAFDECAFFWNQQSLHYNDKTYMGVELLRFLVDESQRMPVDFVHQIANRMEHFCYIRKRDFKRIWIKAIRTIGQGAPFEPKTIAWLLSSALPHQIKADNYKQLVFECFHAAGNRLGQGCCFSRLRTRITADMTISNILLFNDTIWGDTVIEPLDSDALFGPEISLLPLVFNDTPFDFYAPLSQRQSVFSRLPEGQGQIIDNIFYIHKRRYGHLMRFGQFLENQQLTIPCRIDLDATVVHIDSNYFCPVRKRIWLNQGCVYGAPLDLIEFFYSARSDNKHIPDYTAVNLLLDRLMFHSHDSWKAAYEKHERFIAFLSKPVTIEYNPETDSIYADKQFITSGIQAKILWKIISLSLAENRKNFQRRELTTLRDCISSSDNTGFATRLNRIKDRLKLVCPQLSLVKEMRGRFRLESSVTIKANMKNSIS